MMILDACRNNPLSRTLKARAAQLGRSAETGTGLSEIDGACGMLIAYATNPNNVALDGEGQHSPFTSALLKHLDDPVDVRLMFGRVREKVVAATDGQQTPWVEEAVLGEYSLAAAAPEPVQEEDDEQTLPPGADPEIVFWESIRNSEKPAEFEAYLERWPEGTFASLAESRLAALREPADDPQPKPENQPDQSDKQLELGRADIRYVQRALGELGHDPKGVDGLMGPMWIGRGSLRRTARGQDRNMLIFRVSRTLIGVPVGCRSTRCPHDRRPLWNREMHRSRPDRRARKRAE